LCRVVPGVRRLDSLRVGGIDAGSRSSRSSTHGETDARFRSRPREDTNWVGVVTKMVTHVPGARKGFLGAAVQASRRARKKALDLTP
jgi:hypothetical protein